MTTDRARDLEQWARASLQPDAHAGADGSYVVASLYFDSAALDSYCRGGAAGWPKYRLRSYGAGTMPLFLEEKVRRGDAVWKRRVPCTVDDWGDRRPGDRTPGLRWFRGRWQRLGLLPVLHVRYRRLAFVAPSGERLTIDGEIACHRADPAAAVLVDAAGAFQPIPTPPVVELKYAGQPSTEMLLALREVQDEPVRHSKYSLGIRALGLCADPTQAS